MGFTDELRNRTMTPQDARRKEAESARQEGYAFAEKEYQKIKNTILWKAEHGEYEITFGKRRIRYYHQMPGLSYITFGQRRKMFTEPGLFKNKTYFKSVYTMFVKSECEEEYKFFIQKIQNLGLEDDIRITPMLYNKHKEETSPFPCYDITILFNMVFCLECEISY